ncbi:MAG: hypothetical protein MJB14_13670, partial [Spirochaetes bacterium]|nr:hypothetical protein [Spirochaetota bacterium]
RERNKTVAENLRKKKKKRHYKSPGDTGRNSLSKEEKSGSSNSSTENDNSDTSNTNSSTSNNNSSVSKRESRKTQRQARRDARRERRENRRQIRQSNRQQRKLNKDAGLGYKTDQQVANQQKRQANKLAKQQAKNKTWSGFGEKGAPRAWLNTNLKKWKGNVDHYNETEPDRMNELENQLGEVFTDDGKIINSKTNILKEWLNTFDQKVTTGEDVVDKFERAKETILGKVDNGEFVQGIEGDDAKKLKKLLLHQDDEGNTITDAERLKQQDEDFNSFVEDQIEGLSDTKAGRMQGYLNGLKYMADNKDNISVELGLDSCALISDYICGVANNKIDPAQTNFEKFFINKFEEGTARDVKGAPPVSNYGFGYDESLAEGKRSTDCEMERTDLWISSTIEDKDIYIRVVPDLNDQNKTKEIWEGMSNEQVNKRIAEITEKKEKIQAVKDEIAELDSYRGEFPVSSTLHEMSKKNEQLKTLEKKYSEGKYAEALKQYNKLLTDYNDLKNTDLTSFETEMENQNLVVGRKMNGSRSGHFFIVGRDSETNDWKLYDHNTFGGNSWGTKYNMDRHDDIVRFNWYE